MSTASPKFDIIVGNPPYGKNSNLAVRFLNLSGQLSDRVCYVLPRTFRKHSIQNRVCANLHLIHDQTVPDCVFPGTIITCYQIWQRTTALRPHHPIVSSNADLTFVDPASADVCVGRVGEGPCGRVFLDRFDQRSVNSHYFIKVSNPQVITVLQSLTHLFRAAGEQTVGLPSLSKNELISIYQAHISQC